MDKASEKLVVLCKRLALWLTIHILIDSGWYEILEPQDLSTTPILNLRSPFAPTLPPPPKRTNQQPDAAPPWLSDLLFSRCGHKSLCATIASPPPPCSCASSPRCIYFFYHISMQKFYIGQTKPPLSKRIAAHTNPASNAPSRPFDDASLRKALRSCPPEDFFIHALARDLSNDALDLLEEECILSLDTLIPHGYNVNLGRKPFWCTPTILSSRLRSASTELPQIPISLCLSYPNKLIEHVKPEILILSHQSLLNAIPTWILNTNLTVFCKYPPPVKLFLISGFASHIHWDDDGLAFVG
ncbi:hypothetical protein CYMTET_34303 [Cymbomonas tetramitiformis]|uniref:GIY-YIG domain-containing protein n=1 Tax=Cymbomonas tetramitiformis TaxID=36881 RepID=A0AAE0KQB4_9CHLO|nr:hypothetical protein CYMTET_34303 [Cymbomonas tetramitiformis]